MEEVGAAKGEVVGTDVQIIRDLKVNQEAKNCSILTIRLNQAGLLYKSVPANLHVPEDLRQKTRIKSSEHQKDQMQAERVLGFQIEEGKRVDFLL